MAGLLADGWFYISSAGLLVSGVLFFFLLSQYRAAGDAADQNEAEAAVEAAPAVHPVWTPDRPASAARVASVEKSEEKPAPASVPSAAAPKAETAAQAEKRRETTTGGVNPAVVYLQNIKLQLDQLHAETQALAKTVEAITGRDEALIERLGELAQAVAELKAAAPAPARAAAVAAAPAETPAPKRVKKAEVPAVAAAPAPEAAPVEPAPAPATPPTLTIEPSTSMGVTASKAVPVTKPVAKKEMSADDTIRMDLDAAIASQLAPAAKPEAQAAPAEKTIQTAPAEKTAPAEDAAAPVPAPSAEPAEPERPRRGPVWPV